MWLRWKPSLTVICCDGKTRPDSVRTRQISTSGWRASSQPFPIDHKRVLVFILTRNRTALSRADFDLSQFAPAGIPRGHVTP